MKQDMILILDLGSEENPRLAREIRAMGVYTEIHPHDITADELAALPGVKGIILNGGPNRVVDGVEIDVSAAVYGSGLPVWAVDHKGSAPLAADGEARETAMMEISSAAWLMMRMLMPCSPSAWKIFPEVPGR